MVNLNHLTNSWTKSITVTIGTKKTVNLKHAVKFNWIVLSSITFDREQILADCGLTVVKKAFRGSGIASILKEKTIEYAKEQEIHKMITNLHDENYSMLAVNQKFGFMEIKKDSC